MAVALLAPRQLNPKFGGTDSACGTGPRSVRNFYVQASIRFMTRILGHIVLLSSTLSDPDHRPPASARIAIELISDRLTDLRGRIVPKSTPSRTEMDAISKRGVDRSGKFHTTAGVALSLSIACTAGNPHVCGDWNAAAT